MGRITTRRNVTRVRGDTSSTRPDTLVVEEPLEIRLGGRSLAVTMRTPGNDFELAAGFLTTEGVITSAADITDQRYCTGARPDTQYNIVNVTLAPGVRAPDPSVERAFYTTSSCGICGKGSIDAVHTVASWRVAEDPAPVAGSVLAGLPELLRRHQAVFERTGGLHAAGLFSTGGELLCLREDVGRHNAVDKVIGWACARDMLPLRGCVLQVSGRASFELVQKALMAGIPVMSAVSAPSSLAVDLAAESGITLAGFVRGETMNIYTGGHRIRTEPSEAVSGPGSLASTIS